MAPPRRLVEAGGGVFLCVLAGQGMLLPRKLYSQTGRVAKSLLAGGRSCPGSFIRKEAGARKLAGLG